jgi:hypothetical protein
MKILQVPDPNEKDTIIETATGKSPGFIEGIPFPVIDENDPHAGAKLICNREYGLLFNAGFQKYCK